MWVHINYIEVRFISWIVVKIFDNDATNDDVCFLHDQTDGFTHGASSLNRPTISRDTSNVRLRLNEDGKYDKSLYENASACVQC